MTTATGQSDIDLVREATDLVGLIGEHIALRPKGREHIGLCPFHDDGHPSLTVVTHKGNAFYKCHSCGAAGDAFNFVMQYHQMDFGTALRHLADRAGIALRRRDEAPRRDGEPSRSDLKAANQFAATFFRKVLQASEAGATARAVIRQRGIGDEAVEAFGLGAAPAGWEGLARLVGQRLPAASAGAAGLLKQRSSGGLYDAFRNRLMFPICDETGTAVAFGGRVVDPADEPKYLNSAESPIFQKSRTLYGMHLARRTIIDTATAIVTEGYLDVIACHEAGFSNAVGTLGTALTPDHARLLSRLCDTVILVFDGDAAGQRAADRAVEVFFAERVDIRICVLPDGQDPDDLLRHDARGPERFRAALDSADDALAYKVRRFQGQLEGVESISGRQKRLETILGELVELGFERMQGVRKRLVLARLAELMQVAPEDIERSMPARRRAAAPTPERVAPGDGPAADLFDRGAGVTRARRLAECEVLALLIYEPGLAQAPLDVDGRTVTATALLTTGAFIEAGNRRIAEAVLGRLRSQQPLTMQLLLADLDEPELQKTASMLYFEGEHRCGDDPRVGAEQLADAARALCAHLEREQYQLTVDTYRATASSGRDALTAAQAMLDHRRRQGDIASAIPAGVRSSS